MDDDDCRPHPTLRRPRTIRAGSWAGSLLFCDIELKAPTTHRSTRLPQPGGGVDEEAPEPEPPSPAPARAPVRAR